MRPRIIVDVRAICCKCNLEMTEFPISGKDSDIKIYAQCSFCKSEVYLVNYK